MKILVLLVLALIVSLIWANLDAGDLVLYERTAPINPNLAANEDPSANSVVLLVTASGGIFGVDSRNGAILWGFNSGRKLFSSSLASIVPGLDGMLYYTTPDGLKANPFSVQEIAERSPLYVGDETIYIASKSTSLLRILPLTGQIVLPSSLPSHEQDVIVLGRTDYLVRAIDRRTNRQIWNVTLSRFTRQGYCSSNGKPNIEQEADESSDHSQFILSSLTGKVEMLHVYHSQQRDSDADNDTAFRLDLSEDELAVDENDQVTRLTRAWELYFDSPIAYVFSTGSTSSLHSFPGVRLGSDEISLFYQEQFVSCASNVIFIGELANSFYALPRLHFRSTGSNSRNTNDVNVSASRQLIPYTPPANDYVALQYVDYEWFKLLQTLLVNQPELVLTSCTDDSFDFPYCMLGPQLLVQEGGNETDFGDNVTKNTTDPMSELRESSYTRFKIRIAIFAILVIGLLTLFIGVFAKERIGLGKKSETLVPKSVAPAPLQNDVEQIAENPDEPIVTPEEPEEKQSAIEDSAPEVVAELKLDETIDSQSGSADDASTAVPTPTKPQRVGDILTIGKIEVNLSQVLGYGSSGTVVFEGKFQDRRVAVKRIMNYFYHIAQREMEILLHSDDHPSIIRYFAKEQDDEFIYLALAVCSTTLDQYILSPAFKTVEASVLSRILLEISLGVAHLHRLNIVHRDLKPQNVLLDNLLRAKISDMGLAKRLAREELSFSTDTKGTAGWQPHEVITDVSVRRTKSVDIFSLGCIIYYVLTSLHPFGSRFEHQHNIVHDKPNLEKLSDPVALDLVQNMIRYLPNERLPITDVCNHIYFWNTETKLEFLKDLSDRLEFEDINHALVVRFEELAVQRKILGPKMDWSASLGKALLEDLKKFRQYKPSKLRPLLRVIRNKANHHFDLPLPLREEFGNFPEGYLNYYQSRFPLLVPFCYMFFRTECIGEQQLNEKYLKYK